MTERIWKKIGEVSVDSGQLIVQDPCYHNLWVESEFKDIRIYQNIHTGARLQYQKDFPHYEALVEPYQKSMNELLASGDWEEVYDNSPAPVGELSYNAVCRATLGRDTGGRFQNGQVGLAVAFPTFQGDGIYPVYALFEGDNVCQVLVDTAGLGHP